MSFAIILHGALMVNIAHCNQMIDEVGLTLSILGKKFSRRHFEIFFYFFIFFFILFFFFFIFFFLFFFCQKIGFGISCKLSQFA